MPLDDAPDIPDPNADAETVMLLAETTLRVLSCLDALESRQREAIRSAFYHGLTYAELAERDQVPIGTMKSWIRRGLYQMRQTLENQED